MACGIPVIASYTGILQEVNQQAYKLINPKRPEQIAESVLCLKNNHNLRNLQVSNGLAEAKKYMWEEGAHQTMSLYRELAKSYRSSKSSSNEVSSTTVMISET